MESGFSPASHFHSFNEYRQYAMHMSLNPHNILGCRSYVKLLDEKEKWDYKVL